MKKKVSSPLKKGKFNYIKKNTLIEIFGIILIFIISLYSNKRYPFPHFLFFFFVFLFIGVGASFAILYYNQTINAVISLTVKEPPCEIARIKIQKYHKLKINWIIPLLVIIIFGVGGCMIFSNLELTPTFLCCILIFIPVVYVSITGYLKYVYLCIFIHKIAFSTKRYKNLPIMNSAKIPPVINWYKKIENLFIIYQGAFFTLGLLYIIAFWKFCFSPEYGVYMSSIIFYFLWGVIFVAIVLTFPMIVYFEKNWIKKIQENIMEYYFLESKKEILFFEQKKGFSELFADAIRMNLIEGILDKKENEILCLIFEIYSKAMSIVNFVVSIITIIQFCQIDIQALFKAGNIY